MALNSDIASLKKELAAAAPEGQVHIVWTEPDELPDAALARFKQERPWLTVEPTDRVHFIGFQGMHEQHEEQLITTTPGGESE